MIKPNALKKGDTVALVSLSSGMAGESSVHHRYETGKRRMEEVFGLKTVTMPNALKGIDYLDRHPEARASDLMDAFLDKSISGIICMIGGEDTIRLLPYIDYQIIRNNPKIFMGYSDTTTNHFMMNKAGVVSFHGPCVMVEFAENTKMHDYTVDYINKVLFHKNHKIEIKPSGVWTSEYIEWENIESRNKERKMVKDTRGFEVLQGRGIIKGQFLGGCLGVFSMILGTDIWPRPEEWKNKFLCLETADDYPTPEQVRYFLRNLDAQGLFKELSGIIVGKPLDEKYYEEYKLSFIKVVAEESGMKDLPIIYNVNFGHNSPTCILPFGVDAEIDCDNKKIWIKESPVL